MGSTKTFGTGFSLCSVRTAGAASAARPASHSTLAKSPGSYPSGSTLRPRPSQTLASPKMSAHAVLAVDDFCMRASHTSLSVGP